MSKKRKRLIEKTTTVIDGCTGEITKTTTDSIFYLKREPDFIKLYLQDLLKLNDLQANQVHILYALLQIMNYNNQIILNSAIKRDIANKVRVAVGTIDNALTKFKDSGILISNERGVYIANPQFFAKGDWSSISKLRMEIEYDKKKGRRINTAFDFTNNKEGKCDD